ncbi:MAG: NAD(P)/FAD-dependent oxidoreductase, partial [Mesorhizobium sp.]
IATGSKPRSLPIPGAEHVTISDDVLNDPVLPRAVVFIGGGVIAFELGHVYARAGAEVTILEALPHLLGTFDADAVAQILSERSALAFMFAPWLGSKRSTRSTDACASRL